MWAPHFEAPAAQMEPLMRLGKLDTEAEPELGARFGIRSIPTLVLIQGGREIARASGALPAAEVARWAREHLPGSTSSSSAADSPHSPRDRKDGVEGKRVEVRRDLGGRRNMKNKKKH